MEKRIRKLRDREEYHKRGYEDSSNSRSTKDSSRSSINTHTSYSYAYTVAFGELLFLENLTEHGKKTLTNINLQNHEMLRFIINTLVPDDKAFAKCILIGKVKRG